MEQLNQQVIKYSNLKRLYGLISKNDNISRARLAEITKLSKTTVSALVDELISKGYVVENGSGQSRHLGRKPTNLSINGEKNFIAVMSWRRNRFILSLISTAGDISFCRVFEYTPQENYVAMLARLFYSELLPRAGEGRILGLCVIVPAMVDEKRHKLISTVLHLDEEDKVIDRLRQTIDEYPIAILNDTACFAYAECIYSGIQEKEFAYININRGVGAVLMNRGEMLRGANGMTTQFGHFSIDRQGRTCTCGNKGCLEALIGESALPYRAGECGALELFENPEKILFCDVGALAQKGNEKALEFIRLLAEDLAFGLSNLVSVYNPQLIVIGGTGVNLGYPFLEQVSEYMKTMGFPRFLEHVKVRYTILNESAELQGAARYYMDKHFHFGGKMKNRLFLL